MVLTINTVYAGLKDYDGIYKKMSKKYSVPLEEVRALGYTESKHGDDKRVEPKGNTQGIMHVTPKTFIAMMPQLSCLKSLKADQIRAFIFINPELDIEAGVKYYSKMRNIFKTPAGAYGGYNMGPVGFRRFLKRGKKPTDQKNVKRFVANLKRYRDGKKR